MSSHLSSNSNLLPSPSKLNPKVSISPKPSSPVIASISKDLFMNDVEGSRTHRRTASNVSIENSPQNGAMKHSHIAVASASPSTNDSDSVQSPLARGQVPFARTNRSRSFIHHQRSHASVSDGPEKRDTAPPPPPDSFRATSTAISNALGVRRILTKRTSQKDLLLPQGATPNVSPFDALVAASGSDWGAMHPHTSTNKRYGTGLASYTKTIKKPIKHVKKNVQKGIAGFVNKVQDTLHGGSNNSMEPNALSSTPPSGGAQLLEQHNDHSMAKKQPGKLCFTIHHAILTRAAAKEVGAQQDALACYLVSQQFGLLGSTHFVHAQFWSDTEVRITFEEVFEVDNLHCSNNIALQLVDERTESVMAWCELKVALHSGDHFSKYVPLKLNQRATLSPNTSMVSHSTADPNNTPHDSPPVQIHLEIVRKEDQTASQEYTSAVQKFESHLERSNLTPNDESFHRLKELNLFTQDDMTGSPSQHSGRRRSRSNATAPSPDRYKHGGGVFDDDDYQIAPLSSVNSASARFSTDDASPQDWNGSTKRLRVDTQRHGKSRRVSNLSSNMYLSPISPEPETIPPHVQTQSRRPSLSIFEERITKLQTEVENLQAQLENQQKTTEEIESHAAESAIQYRNHIVLLERRLNALESSSFNMSKSVNHVSSEFPLLQNRFSEQARDAEKFQRRIQDLEHRLNASSANSRWIDVFFYILGLIIKYICYLIVWIYRLFAYFTGTQIKQDPNLPGLQDLVIFMKEERENFSKGESRNRTPHTPGSTVSLLSETSPFTDVSDAPDSDEPEGIYHRDALSSGIDYGSDSDFASANDDHNRSMEDLDGFRKSSMRGSAEELTSLLNKDRFVTKKTRFRDTNDYFDDASSVASDLSDQLMDDDLLGESEPSPDRYVPKSTTNASSTPGDSLSAEFQDMDAQHECFDEWYRKHKRG